MAQALEQAKAARNAAHETFQAQLLQVQEDLEARGIGGRIADRAGEVAAEAADVANEHKGVVAGTVTAILLWLFRDPIIKLIGRLIPDDEDDANNRSSDDD